MSGFNGFEIVKRTPSHYVVENSSLYPPKTMLMNPCFSSFPIVEGELEYISDILWLNPRSSTLFDEVDALTYLIHGEETPSYYSSRRLTRFLGHDFVTEFYLQSLSDRVADLELGFDKLVKGKKIGERKYTWTAEIKNPDVYGGGRNYRWKTEIQNGKASEKTFKWSVETKGKSSEFVPIKRTFTYKVSNHDESSDSEKEKKVKKKNKPEKAKGKSQSVGSRSRIVDIEDPFNHGALVLKQVFANRVENLRGERQILSPQDAATLIQISFRGYLIRRSKVLRALRELAIAKTKLKEIRALFNSFTYRRLLAGDAEERQRFSEKIIVLLLTVDAIEGADRTVRAAKESMVDELEAMLGVVDPQPPGKSWSIRRRTFDMPDSSIHKELAAGVAKVVRLIDEDAISEETFDA